MSNNEGKPSLIGIIATVIGLTVFVITGVTFAVISKLKKNENKDVEKENIRRRLRTYTKLN